jgi:hypothetical protein
MPLVVPAMRDVWVTADGHEFERELEPAVVTPIYLTRLQPVDAVYAAKCCAYPSLAPVPVGGLAGLDGLGLSVPPSA